MQTVAATVRLGDWLGSAGGLALELHAWRHHEAQSPFSLTVAIAPVGAERESAEVIIHSLAT
jgi:hypothetical protein